MCLAATLCLAEVDLDYRASSEGVLTAWISSAVDAHKDADGMGAGVRGDVRVLNEQRLSAGRTQGPEGEMIPGRKNQDYFANLEAMSWMAQRMRFLATHRAVAEDKAEHPDNLISLSSELPEPELPQLLQELSPPDVFAEERRQDLGGRGVGRHRVPEPGRRHHDLLCPGDGVHGDMVEVVWTERRQPSGRAAVFDEIGV